MQATIEVAGLRKRFGPTVALDGMSFTVAAGQVTGFIGPNGAGKSTTMRVILGLDAADEGSALVGGRPYTTLHRPLTHLGSLLDAAALQPVPRIRGRGNPRAPQRGLARARLALHRQHSWRDPGARGELTHLLPLCQAHDVAAHGAHTHIPSQADRRERQAPALRRAALSRPACPIT